MNRKALCIAKQIDKEITNRVLKFEFKQECWGNCLPENARFSFIYIQTFKAPATN